MNVTVAVADTTAGYGQFKRVASEAVQVADMRVVVSEERRTIGSPPWPVTCN